MIFIVYIKYIIINNINIIKILYYIFMMLNININIMSNNLF